MEGSLEEELLWKAKGLWGKLMGDDGSYQ